METDVPADRVVKVWNPLTKANEYTVEGNVPLQNPKFIKRN